MTPVKVDELRAVLKESEYHKQDLDNFRFLIDGFSNGFRLEFEGDRRNLRQTAPNLKFTVGDKFILWEKVMKEVKLKRYAGPFDRPPYENYIQSPIGLVPKDSGKSVRLIFHLSYP